MNHPRYLEDLTVGEGNTTREIAVSEADILDFARRYDPQDMHTQASSRGAFDGLIASGWHTAALVMRLLVDSHPLGGTPLLGLGVEDLCWPKPVRPGDIIKAETEVLSITRSRSKPDYGVVRLKVTAYNQHRDVVYLMTPSLWVPCRNP
ncbi:MAG: MaoC/PaaZ C-terminal domain-containing protein [Bryobacteraceae bacterium]